LKLRNSLIEIVTVALRYYCGKKIWRVWKCVVN